MAMHTFALTPGRLNKFKGQILKHAVAEEVLQKQGRHVMMPKNESDTYVARRFLPYGASSTDRNTQNRFFQDGTGDRGNAMVIAHQTQEGVTALPESIVPQDVTCVIQEYSCLYGYTNKTYDLYEDNIPKAMTEQIGERVSLVNEMIVYGALRSCTNVYYAGSGTSIATVNGGPTLGMVRRITKNLKANHGKMVTKILKAAALFDTSPVAAGYFVYCHTNLEPDIRDLPGFVPVEKYASGTPMPNEIGKVETFRFITSPDLPELQDAGAAIGTTDLYTTSGSNIDVYPMIVCAQEAWSQVAVRGLESLNPTFLPPGHKDKSDPHGQRGYAGTIWRKAVMVENHGWMAVAYVGSKNLA